MKRRLLKTVEGTSFKDCPIVPVAARVGGSEVMICQFMVYFDW